MDRVRGLISGEDLWKKGYGGKFVTVAVLDSGVYPHPDFRERIVGFQDMIGGKISCYDDYGHGTHVAGILGGNGALSGGKYRGIAPECSIFSVKILDRRGNGNRKDVVRALDWVMRYGRRYGIRVVNISVGAAGGEEDCGELEAAVEAAWDAGFVVVAAAGNMGPEAGSVTSPGSSRKIITVGSSDDDENFQKGLKGIRPGYSGRGPTCDCVVKPEILAPGSGIISCNSRIRFTHRAYTVKSGTSMATPVVAGGAALLLGREREMSNVDVKIRMKESGEDLGYSKARQGWGQINLKKL